MASNQLGIKMLERMEIDLSLIPGHLTRLNLSSFEVEMSNKKLDVLSE